MVHIKEKKIGPVVKTSPSNSGGMGSIPGQRAKKPKYRTEAIL